MSKIPEGWKRYHLSEICDVMGGGTPDRENPEYWNGNIPWVDPCQITKLKSIFISRTQECITDSGLNNSAAKILPIGTVLMTSRATIGLTAINTIPMTTNQGFQSLICKSSVYNIFLHYLISFQKNELMKIAAGSTFLEVSSRSVKSLSIPLPPLEEQKKIAEILSSVDRSIEATEKLISKLSDLKKALMQELFTKGIGHSRFKNSPLGKIPEEWEVVRLGRIAKIQGGFAFKSTDDSKSGIRWLKIANTGIGKAKWEDISYLPSHFIREYQSFLLKSGDVVIAMTRPVLNRKLKIAKLTEDDVPALLNQRVGRLLPQNDKLHLTYAFYYLQQQNTADNIEKIIFGTDPPNISSKEIESLYILRPSIKEQTEIASILSANDAKIEKAQKRLEKLKDMKKALMQDLLTGKKRVNHETH